MILNYEGGGPLFNIVPMGDTGAGGTRKEATVKVKHLPFFPVTQKEKILILA